MKNFPRYIVARLQERSTWLGLVSLATALGLVLTELQVEAVIAAGTALAGLVAALTPDHGMPPVDHVEDKDTSGAA